jgi:hypothetical protein
MKKIPTTACNGGPKEHANQPLGSPAQADRLQAVPVAPSGSEPATETSTVRRALTFTSAFTGQEVTLTCMPGCTTDHAKFDSTPAHPEDICCNIAGTAGELQLYGPLCETSGPEDFRFLDWQIDVRPFSRRPAERLPFAVIEAFDEHVVEYLDPDALEMLIGHVQERVDSLRKAHAQLIEVRASYLNPPTVAA